MPGAARLLATADDILRGRPARAEGSAAGPLVGHDLVRLGVILVVFGMLYGAIMGTFGGLGGDRLWLLLYSAIKVPLLLTVTFIIALPSYFVLNTLLGVRDDFPVVFRALIEAQAGLTVVLASLAPFTIVWYASVPVYPAAILFNAMIFTIASVTGQYFLRRAYVPLVAQNPVHRILLRGWLVIYAFVGIQCGWVLRPFIGAPHQPAQFFRSEAWGNAYVEVLKIVLRMVK
jgi:hypothetical protein